MLKFLLRAKRDCRALADVRGVASRIGRGVHKRIDENRELLELLQARAPDFLASHPWIEGWLASHDDFFTEVARAAAIDNPHDARNREIPGFRFPRPWPGRPSSIGQTVAGDLS